LLKFQEIIASQRPNPVILEEFTRVDSLPKNISRKLVANARWLLKNDKRNNGKNHIKGKL
jgi:hypothetical protein